MFWKNLANSRSKIFAACLACFVLGVTLASLIGLSREEEWVVGWLVLIFFLSLVIIQVKKWRVIVMLAIFLLLGCFRFILSEPIFNQSNLRFYSQRRVIVRGWADSDGEISGNYQRIYFQTNELKFFTEDNYKKVNGRTIVYLDKYPLYYFGEELELSCSLTDPNTLNNEDDFSYANYLRKENVWAVCFNAGVISRFEHRHFSVINFFLNLKSYFNQKINYFLPEPHSSFLRGLLYGDRGSIPQELKNAFSQTGITHIIAISGYNITIIVAGLLILARSLHIRRRYAFGLTLVIIGFFVLLTGASASVCRAAVMGGLVLWGKNWGRKISAGRLLILTATIMLFLNPRLLWFDAGFQLSFLSTIGLIYFSPLLEKHFQNWSNCLGLKETILTTLAAIIFTSPFIIFLFGRFSVIALLANLLILPVIPLAMLSGFVTLIGGLICVPLGQFLAYVSWFILSYIIKVALYLSSWKFSSVNLNFPWWLIVLFYSLLFYFIYAEQQKNKN